MSVYSMNDLELFSAAISKDTFDASKLYRMVVFQAGKTVADNELNELQQIVTWWLRMLGKALSAGRLIRLIDNYYNPTGGFTAEAVTPSTVGGSYGLPDALNIQKGFSLADGWLLFMPNDWLIRNITWDGREEASTGAGVVTVYLDIYDQEISSQDDPEIIIAGAVDETTRRLKLRFVANSVVGTTLPEAPAGHTYVALCRLTGRTESGVIAQGQIDQTDQPVWDGGPTVTEGALPSTVLLKSTFQRWFEAYTSYGQDLKTIADLTVGTSSSGGGLLAYLSGLSDQLGSLVSEIAGARGEQLTVGRNIARRVLETQVPLWVGFTVPAGQYGPAGLNGIIAWHHTQRHPFRIERVDFESQTIVAGVDAELEFDGEAICSIAVGATQATPWLADAEGLYLDWQTDSHHTVLVTSAGGSTIGLSRIALQGTKIPATDTG